MGELEDAVLRHQRDQQMLEGWRHSVVQWRDPILIRPVGRTHELVESLIAKITRWDSVLVATAPDGTCRALDERPDLHDERSKRLGIPSPDFSHGPKHAMAAAGTFQSQRSLKRQNDAWDRFASEQIKTSTESRRKHLVRPGAMEAPGRWVTDESYDSYEGCWNPNFALCVTSDGRLATRSLPRVHVPQTPDLLELLELHADDIARAFASWLGMSK
jgi:hypothetical protein